MKRTESCCGGETEEVTPAPTVESSAEPEVSVPSAPLLSAAKKTGVPEPAYIEERSLVRRRQDSIQSQIEFSDFFLQVVLQLFYSFFVRLLSL